MLSNVIIRKRDMLALHFFLLFLVFIVYVFQKDSGATTSDVGNEMSRRMSCDFLCQTPGNKWCGDIIAFCLSIYPPVRLAENSWARAGAEPARAPAARRRTQRNQLASPIVSSQLNRLYFILVLYMRNPILTFAQYQYSQRAPSNSLGQSNRDKSLLSYSIFYHLSSQIHGYLYVFCEWTLFSTCHHPQCHFSQSCYVSPQLFPHDQ